MILVFSIFSFIHDTILSSASCLAASHSSLPFSRAQSVSLYFFSKTVSEKSNFSNKYFSDSGKDREPYTLIGFCAFIINGERQTTSNNNSFFIFILFLVTDCKDKKKSLNLQGSEEKSAINIKKGPPLRAETL